MIPVSASFCTWVNRTGFSPVTEYWILTNTRHTSPTATNRNAIEAVGAGNKRRVHHTNHTNKKLQNEKTCHIYVYVYPAARSDVDIIISNDTVDTPFTSDQGLVCESWMGSAQRLQRTVRSIILIRSYIDCTDERLYIRQRDCIDVREAVQIIKRLYRRQRDCIEDIVTVQTIERLYRRQRLSRRQVDCTNDRETVKTTETVQMTERLHR